GDEPECVVPPHPAAWAVRLAGSHPAIRLLPLSGMLLAAPVTGQWRADAVSASWEAWSEPVIGWAAPDVRTLPSVPVADSIAPGGARFGGALLGGLTGLAIGAGAGFLLGAGTDACGDEWCPLATLTIGAALGESVGMAAGAHLVNRGGGDLFRGAMMTTLVGAAGIGLASAF